MRCYVSIRLYGGHMKDVPTILKKSYETDEKVQMNITLSVDEAAKSSLINKDMI